jgi:rubrerythrin
MSKYINLDRVKEVFDYAENEFCECDYAVKNIREAVENLPAADVRPVVIGRWEQTADGYDFDGNLIFDSWNCSNCGYEADGEDEPDFLYCPNCGARMEE